MIMIKLCVYQLHKLELYKLYMYTGNYSNTEHMYVP